MKVEQGTQAFINFVLDIFEAAGFLSETNSSDWQQAREHQETRTKNIIYIYLYVRMPSFYIFFKLSSLLICT